MSTIEEARKQARVAVALLNAALVHDGPGVLREHALHEAAITARRVLLDATEPPANVTDLPKSDIPPEQMSVKGQSQPAEDEREALRNEFEYRIRTAVAYGRSYERDGVQEKADWIQREIVYAMSSLAVTAVLRDSGPRPITDEMLGSMAQAFFEATGTPGSGIQYTRMIVKPEIVAGLRAALEAAEEARR